MDKRSKTILAIIGFVTVVASIAAAVAMIFVRMEKRRKDDEELEHYIETAIE